MFLPWIVHIYENSLSFLFLLPPQSLFFIHFHCVSSSCRQPLTSQPVTVSWTKRLINRPTLFSPLPSLQLCPATRVGIPDSYSTATSRGPRSILATRSATAVTQATCWKVTRPSPVWPPQREPLPGTSLCPTAEVSSWTTWLHVSQLLWNFETPQKYIRLGHCFSVATLVFIEAIKNWSKLICFWRSHYVKFNLPLFIPCFLTIENEDEKIPYKILFLNFFCVHAWWNSSWNHPPNTTDKALVLPWR